MPYTLTLHESSYMMQCLVALRPDTIAFGLSPLRSEYIIELKPLHYWSACAGEKEYRSVPKSQPPVSSCTFLSTDLPPCDGHTIELTRMKLRQKKSDVC